MPIRADVECSLSLSLSSRTVLLEQVKLEATYISLKQLKFQWKEPMEKNDILEFLTEECEDEQ